MLCERAALSAGTRPSIYFMILLFLYFHDEQTMAKGSEFP